MAKEKLWKSPWVVYITITSLISLATFFVGHYTKPLSFEINANAKEIAEIKDCLKEKPSKGEITPILEAIREDIAELKEAQREHNRRLQEVYQILLTFNLE